MNWKYLFIIISILTLLFISGCESDTVSEILPIIEENEVLSLSRSELTMAQGEFETTTLTIRNQDSDTISVSATVEAIAFGGETVEALICEFDDTGLTNTNTYDLNPDESISIGLIAKDDGLATGIYACLVTLSELADGVDNISLIVQIE